MNDDARIQSGEHANGTGGGTPVDHGNKCDGDEHPALSVAAEPFGHDQATVDAAVAALLAHPSVRQAIGANEHQIYGVRSFNDAFARVQDLTPRPCHILHSRPGKRYSSNSCSRPYLLG